MDVINGKLCYAIVVTCHHRSISAFPSFSFQELLQLQYEGVAVMNMFGKARINVNLLLHLVNVKFYGSKKKMQ